MSQKIILEFETLSYGKTIERNAPGAVQPNATYDIKQVSPGLQGKSEYYPHNLTSVELAPQHIDPEFEDRGALVLRSVPDGLLLTRLKFRPDGGKGNTTSRSFMLARTILVPGWQRGCDIHPEFLLWSCKEFRAEPFYGNTPHTEHQKSIEVEKWTKDVFQNHLRPVYNQYKDTFIQGCFDSMIRKSIDYRGLGMILPRSASPTEPPVDATFFAEQNVLISMYIAATHAKRKKGNWDFNLNISIGLSPAAGTSDLYFSSQISHETALSLGDLKKEDIYEPVFPQFQEINQADLSPINQENANPRPVEIPIDSSGRLIGKEPIDFTIEVTAA